VAEEQPSVGKILLTGAAGRIGSAFREYASSRYRMRLADRDLAALGDGGGHEVVALEASEIDSCRAACDGIDTVLHLAADPSPRADFYGSLLDNNIKGAFNIFRAAKDQGCRRVIFASTIRVFEGYLAGPPISPDAMLRPTDLYAVSKCFGESLAYYFAHAEGLSSIVVRIGGFEGNWARQSPPASALVRFVSRRDMSQLLARCIETPDIHFAIVHGVSDNRHKRLDIDSTRELLDYEPDDDGFELFGDGA
jgi:nucleoside-diphosphate-sugar epimerase